MKCPYCKSELKIEGQKYLETLVEHVEDVEPSLKNSYICSNEDCITRIAKINWNDSGELYCKNYLLEKTIKYINNNNAPFGSLERKFNVEIHKDDENFDLLKIFGWTFRIEFEYQSNENGDILNRKWKIVTITPKNTFHIWGITMFFFVINRKNHRFFTDSNPLKIGKEWWRFASYWWVKIFQHDRFLNWNKQEKECHQNPEGQL